MYAQVILFKKAGEFDDPLTYEIPKELEDQCMVGQGVKMPFRKGFGFGLIVSVSVKCECEGGN